MKSLPFPSIWVYLGASGLRASIQNIDSQFLFGISEWNMQFLEITGLQIIDLE
jgi:hypothetical protein